jgi:hypothetical protein
MRVFPDAASQLRLMDNPLRTERRQFDALASPHRQILR